METITANKLEEITTGHFYYTEKNWVFSLEDEKERQFGLYVEILNMGEATGEEAFKDYPFIVSFSLVPDKVHKSYNEEGNTPSKLGLIFDGYSYCGGVPISLEDTVKGGKEGNGEPFDILTRLFSVNEACIKTDKPKYGTIAAQRGPNKEYKYFQFKTEEAALKLVNYIIEHRVSCLGLMIGFTLDRPINMAGNTGWDTFTSLVRGK